MAANFEDLKKSLKNRVSSESKISMGNVIAWCADLDGKIKKNRYGHFNLDKFIFGADTVEFAGFEITNDIVRTCRKYLDAIRDFLTPANITDVRSWFGLINQVSYAFAANECILPFCQLRTLRLG